jgi:hypothetical protein
VGGLINDAGVAGLSIVMFALLAFLCAISIYAWKVLGTTSK